MGNGVYFFVVTVHFWWEMKKWYSQCCWLYILCMQRKPNNILTSITRRKKTYSIRKSVLKQEDRERNESVKPVKMMPSMKSTACIADASTACIFAIRYQLISKLHTNLKSNKFRTGSRGTHKFLVDVRKKEKLWFSLQSIGSENQLNFVLKYLSNSNTTKFNHRVLSPDKKTQRITTALGGRFITSNEFLSQKIHDDKSNKLLIAKNIFVNERTKKKKDHWLVAAVQLVWMVITLLICRDVFDLSVYFFSSSCFVQSFAYLHCCELHAMQINIKWAERRRNKLHFHMDDGKWKANEVDWKMNGDGWIIMSFNGTSSVYRLISMRFSHNLGNRVI